MIVYGTFSHSSILPTGSLNPKNLTADSLMINAVESEAKSREKSLPSLIVHPIVFPYSYDTVLFGKSTPMLGSFPSQLNPPLVFHTFVSGLCEIAISVMTLSFFNSCLLYTSDAADER